MEHNTTTIKVKEDTSLLLQPYWELAYRAHQGTSFSPERRADSYIKDYSQHFAEGIEKIKNAGGDVERYKAKYISLFTSWMSAKGNCISSMITGPANFPVRIAEKANRSEENKGREFIGYTDKVLKAIAKKKRREDRANGNELEGAKAKLKAQKEIQSFMKEVNKILRSKKTDEAGKLELTKELTPTEERAHQIMRLEHYGKRGFASFELTNLNARIKHTEAKIKKLEAQTPENNNEFMIGDVRVLQNAELNRIQLFFDGKLKICWSLVQVQPAPLFNASLM